MALRAFACPTRFDAVAGTSDQMSIQYQCIVGDGIAPSVDFGGTFIYDYTKTPAQNLAAAKTTISTACGTVGFAGVATTNILINMTMQ